MIASAALRRVRAGQLCAGCGLCAGLSAGTVEMRTEAPGYSRPHQTGSLPAGVEGKIAHACPGLEIARWDEAARAEGAALHRSWGRWLRCLTGHATDPAVRYRGSSGGAISALAIHAVDAGLVERVVHTGADPARPSRNLTVISGDRAEVLENAGSRYAASSPLEQIDALLEAGGTALFIGKPCDVSALRRLATLDERVDRVFPYKLSFFCGGVPSHAGADRIAAAMGLDPARLTHFRYRGDGWPGLTIAEDASGKRGEMRYEDSWGGHLAKEVQFRCKICPDSVGGVADIVGADAWFGGETGYPQFEEEDGRSLVMTRTAAGDRLLDSAIAAGAIEVAPLPIDQIDLMQPSQARRKRHVGARVAACRAMLRPVPRMGGLEVGTAAGGESRLSLAKDFLGTIRRIISGRI